MNELMYDIVWHLMKHWIETITYFDEFLSQLSFENSNDFICHHLPNMK